MYATDASMYQITPLAIALPETESDLVMMVKIASDHKIPIVPRGGGTGLAGQAIGRGLIIDFSKYLNKILEFDEKEKWVVVQPGIVRDQLNAFLRPHRLHFAPDPATSSRANIGGMIANNSSGTKSIIYGKTIDHVLELKVLLSDGTLLHLNAKDPKEYEQICQQNDREGEIYRSIKEIIIANKESIAENFPKVMRRVGGYNLDEFIDSDHWNLSKLIVGSEGTLGIILQAKINLTPLPKSRCACLAHFNSMNEAILAVQKIVPYQPSAVEIIDDTVINFSRKNMATRESCRVIEGDPAAVLFIEFEGEEFSTLHNQADTVAEMLRTEKMGYAFPIFAEGKEYQDILTVRKKGLGLMMGMKTERKPVAFIEDAAIPLEHLDKYILEVDQVCQKYGVQAIKYAHASVGVIHVRPVLNLRDAGDLEILKKIAEETFLLVKKYKGSWSSEHGDGLVRSPFNERFFGPEVYRAFKRIKTLFDPQNLLNPGKIVDSPAMDQNLKYGVEYKDRPIDTFFHYRDSGGFHEEVHMCSGVGECRKVGQGTMCPSYMATRDEKDSTRGRANALRLAMSGQLKSEIYSEEVLNILDLCLSCKACKSECPSNVDMAKLKSEVLQMKYDHSGISLREYFVENSARFAANFSGAPAPLVNAIQSSKIFKQTFQKLLGFDQHRTLPSYSKTSFVKWFEFKYHKPKNPTETVALFVDTYLNYHEPEVGIGSVNLLTKIGIAVEMADVGCCQRPKISNGFLRSAQEHGATVARNLHEIMARNIKVVVCEPSCASALQFDIPDLLDDQQLAAGMSSNVYPLADFIWEKIKDHKNLNIELKSHNLILHGHCHEKSLYGTGSMHQIFKLLGANVKEIDSGCCGMAGSFGYEKEHYDLSKKIGEDRLFPAIENAKEDATIIANGFSCRHQINHFTGRKALFWTQAFE
ncbi:MAG: FAD-binding protein [Saprospiraceae bacterium]|nr:FAD-binding protein [Saprospiraceae bacterium]